jgi:enoyl-CoA hydratase
MSAPGLTGYETLLFDRPRESVLLVRMNRPERLNAISFLMFAEFQRLCDELSGDLATRVVVLTGEGRGFCSGLDLDEAATLPEMTTAQMLNGQEHWAGAMASLRRLPQPIIAAVNGAATGGGLAVALAADIRLASPEARFNAAFVKIGLTAGDVGVSWHLPRVVGLGRAAEIMLTGRFVDADEAERIGLVNRVVASDELVPAALEIAQQIAAHSPLGIRLTKSVLQANVDAGSLESAIELENRGQVLATRSPDMAEALQAFRDGRPPRFEPA